MRDFVQISVWRGGRESRGIKHFWLSTPRGPRQRTEDGFALLITITLLAFLVLLLVSVATLTRVETQVAANTQAAARARQHALLALNVAVGQLQAHAGPDSRLTAQANVLDENAENPWFTGVWTADASGAPVQRTWLVSGNETEPLRFGPNSVLGREDPESETGLSLDVNGVATNGPESAEPNRVQLVGAGSARMTGTSMEHGGVVVPGVPLNAVVPGFAGERTVGRYAFWVGDQGVKASLALADRAEEVRYAPWFGSAAGAGCDQRARIRQQIATAPTFFRRVAGVEERGFDPLDAANAPLLKRVLERGQFELLTPAVAAAPMSAFRRDFFHTFTDRAYSVLANTLPLTSAKRGLMRDLSREPSLLGTAFEAQANLATYMETPTAENKAVPPIDSWDCERRRYRLTSPVVSAPGAEDPAIEFKVAPVLNSFMLQFRVERVAGGAVEVRARMLVELWNPYSVALVPEDLVLEVSGLPRIRVMDAGGSGGSADVDLQAAPPVLSDGGPERALVVKLPFVANGDADRASWLPGRLYAWRTNSGAASDELLFYDKTMGPSWSYATVPLGATHDALRVDVSNEVVLSIRLKRADGTQLASYESPRFGAFSVADVESPPTDGNWKFGFGFRLRQPSSLNRERDWLSVAGRDFRRQAPVAEAYDAFNELLGMEPDLYVGTVRTATDIENYAVFRAFGVARNSTRSANLDLPVFELPRLPYLSVGELQHLILPAERPFAAGNSWGGKANSWFDRFFFSGLTAAVGSGPDLAAGEPLPNWNLLPLSTSIAEADGLSSRHLLQAGGFNVNSALPEAWRAVLSGVRFGAGRAFRRAEIENGASVNVYTGSQSDPDDASAVAVRAEVLSDSTLAEGSGVVSAAVAGEVTDGNAVGGPVFFRFPQSAQETYFWTDTDVAGDFRRQAFRQGVRGGDQAIDGSTLHTLTTDQVGRLAEAIVRGLRERVARTGPFESMQAFLAPDVAWGGRNLLEQAIEDVGINPASIAPVTPVADVRHVGFSSLTLTSADIMTALAPYLRTRSDTFVVRAYGEAINPADQTVESRAWCEAMVQRFPTPVDSSEGDAAALAAGGFGRDFRIIHFRWLTSSDI